MKRFLPHIRASGILALYWFVLFICTHIPRLNLSEIDINTSDRTIHFVAFFILTLIYWWALYGKRPPSYRHAGTYITLALIASYAAIDEITQELVHRTCDIKDWTADMLGTGTALLLLFCLRRTWHWLMVVWISFFIASHLAEWKPQMQVLGNTWRQFEAAYIAVGFLVLTLLLWRSLSSPGRFEINKKIVATTLVVLCFYAVLDQVISVAAGQSFDRNGFIGALVGILGGSLGATAWATHQQQADPYTPAD